MMRRILNFKLFEFNKHDLLKMQETGINDHFTISFEFELECDDNNLKMPESLETLLTIVKQRVIEILEEESIPYDEEFINYYLNSFDLESETFLINDHYEDENQKYAIFLIKNIMEEEVENWYDKSTINIASLDYGKEMVQKHLSNFYKKWNDILKYEFDMSLNKGIEFSPVTYLKTLSSAIDMLDDFFKDFNKQDYWKMNKNTSIHINIGLDKNIEWNIAKGIILLKDFKEGDTPFVYRDIENREETAYTKSLYKIIEKHFSENKFDKFDRNKIEDSINSKLVESFTKYGKKAFAFNISRIMDFGYVEFRYVGGEINEKIMIDKLKYFCYIIFLMTSDWKEKEYIKKLYKIAM